MKKAFYIGATVTSILLLAVLVYAYGGTDPAVHGHSNQEVNISPLILSGNNVGIGTSSPVSRLHIVQDTGNPVNNTGIEYGQIHINPTQGNFYLGKLTFGSIAASASKPTAGVSVNFTGGGTYMTLGTSNSYVSGITNEAVTINPGGQVGIGVTNPSYPLEVSGNIVNTKPSQGWIGLTGDLPGYGTNFYPTLKTGGGYLYFSAGGLYSAYMSNGGTWYSQSSRTKKENYEELDKQEILSKIDSLPVMKWNYKTEDDSITHIGPFSEDFYERFETGNNSKMLSTSDTAGVALVGVKALSEKLKQQEQEIQSLKSIICRNNPREEVCS